MSALASLDKYTESLDALIKAIEQEEATLPTVDTPNLEKDMQHDAKFKFDADKIEKLKQV